MLILRFSANCCTHVFFANSLIHTYYILSFKNLYINTSKKKRKCCFMGTTHTTLLKPAPAANNLLYPHCFCMGTTWVQQPATFRFFNLIFFYLFDLLTFAFCCMLYPCLQLMKTQKTRKNG